MRKLIAAAAVFLLSACGSAPVSVVTGAPGHRDMLFEAEIQTNRIPGMNVYDLLTHLRPEYLRSRGAASLRNVAPPTAVVYIDNVKYGGIDSLRGLSADNITQVQYLSASDATTRFGLDHQGGAILVTTRLN